LTWVDSIALKKDEKIVDSWQGIREIIGTFEVKSDEDKKNERKKVITKERKEGLLVLTTQRLLFFEGHELVGKQRESVKVSLLDVDKILFEKAPLKPIDEEKGFETHVFSLKKVGKKKEFNKFRKLLDEYCKKRKEQLDQETRKVVKFKLV
jgi:hypothetical protein